MAIIVKTEDGSDTIFVPELNEHYHSVHGAIQESMLVFIKNGFKSLSLSEVSILEIGFGTGLNAFLTAIAAAEERKKVTYTSFENNPLDKGFTDILNYAGILGSGHENLFRSMHEAPWDELAVISGFFSLRKLNSDIITGDLEGEYDLVYFDAFGPDKQPGPWSEIVFAKIAAACKPGAVFVTYSAKGEVKRKLKACGFGVSLLPGPPGKREVIRALRK